MCTLTWETLPSGYELHFNRDESRSREKAAPPSIEVKGDTSVICPRDQQAGGTWISVNEYGVGLCILNNYLAAQQYFGVVSRGLLVDDLASAKDSQEIATLMSDLDYKKYSPFDLFIFSPEGEVKRYSWDGNKYQALQPTEKFMSSSGFDTRAVIAERRQLYIEHQTNDLFDARKFHKSRDPERSAYSVCMSRPDAKTLSYSNIRVDQDRCTFIYTDGSPCNTDPLDPLALDRKYAESH